MVSIIVPCREADDYLRECLSRCLELDYPSFEIMVLPDALPTWEPVSDSKVRFVPTGSSKPSIKRNMGIHASGGEICAFLDSDAYPPRNWLRNAVKYFEKPEVAAVGGPSITPGNVDPNQKVAGMIVSSTIAVGSLSFRNKLSPQKEIDDMPTCNMLVRRSVLERLGGFNVDYWPGEDTYLSLQIVKQLNMKIVYSPDVVVYHHRRPLWKPYLRQVAGFGRHRGYFAKKFPENSRKILYFAPSLFVIALIAGIPLSLAYEGLRILYLAGVTAYLGACLIQGLTAKSLRTALMVMAGTVLTHMTYGVTFIMGLLASELKE